LFNFEKELKMDLDKTMKIIDLIESYEIKDFKITDVIHNDLYRHMNDAGLFDYDYIEKGQISAKGVKRKASKTNMVFLIWLMIAKDLKEFGMSNAKLHKVKDYLFTENKIIENLNSEPTRENIISFINHHKFKDEEIKDELLRTVISDDFVNKIGEKQVTQIFYYLFKILYTKSDIILYIKANGEALLTDGLELSVSEVEKLSYSKSIKLPIKNYIVSLISEYANTDFLTRSRILTKNEAILLDEFKRNDIVSLKIRYKNKKAYMYEIKQFTKTKLYDKLSKTLQANAFEDLVIKTKNGEVYYSELTTRKQF